QRDVRIASDVGQARQLRRSLRLRVHARIDHVTFYREHDGHQVGTTVGSHRGHPGHAARGEPAPGLGLVERGHSTPSSDSRNRLRSSPPVYPPSPPPVWRTRWHGTTIGSGFEPSAFPAARYARELPARPATSV